MKRTAAVSGRSARAVSGALALALSSYACTSSRAPVAPATAATPDPVATERERVDAFARVEREATEWLAAADPRLARRLGVTASDAVLKQVGLEAVLAEDATGVIRNGSLDLFAFRARGKALEHAAKVVASFASPLPDVAAEAGPIARPALERELLERVIEEERARAVDESSLADDSGELVRAILETWVPPAAPQEWPERDLWVSRHLREMRDSLRTDRPRTGPDDVDTPLYPLERLLAPLQFPRGAAALAELRVALDADPRVAPPLVTPERLVRSVRLHLGVDVEPGALAARLVQLENALYDRASQALGSSAARGPGLAVARRRVFADAVCSPVAGSMVRSWRPPPERQAVCGVLSAVADEAPEAALVVMHDDLLLALAALQAPPPRTRLLASPQDDAVNTLERAARERPVIALGVALAVELLASSGDPAERARAWRALGEVPLDVARRVRAVAPAASTP